MSKYLYCVVLILFTVIGIIKRKALIKELAAAYHDECLAYCQKLLQLQREWEEVRIHLNLLIEHYIPACFHL